MSSYLLIARSSKPPLKKGEPRIKLSTPEKKKMFDLSLDPSHGLVILVASSTVFINYWQIYHVGSLRKKYGIKYPTMYSAQHNDFNCAPRFHQVSSSSSSSSSKSGVRDLTWKF